MNIERRADIYERFVDELPFGVLIVDGDSIAVCWNRRAEQTTGYQRHQVLGRRCQELQLLGCDRSHAVCGESSCPLKFQGTNGASTEISIEHKEGHAVVLLAEPIPLIEEHRKSGPMAMIFQVETSKREMRLWTSQGSAQWDSEYGLPSLVATREELQMTLPRAGTAVLLIEVEDSEQMARHFGRELLHTVVRKLIRSLSHLVTVPHFLGHWSAHRLLLLVPNCGGEKFQQLVKSLVTASTGYRIRWWGDRIELHVRVNGMVTEENESADQVLERLGESGGRVTLERE